MNRRPLNDYERCLAEKSHMNQTIMQLQEELANIQTHNEHNERVIADRENSLKNRDDYILVLIKKLQKLKIPIPTNPAEYDGDTASENEENVNEHILKKGKGGKSKLRCSKKRNPGKKTRKFKSGFIL